MKQSIATQTGAALIVSLLMLLVMTLLGVSAMQSTILEEKMAGNFRDRNLAFQAGEVALRDGENWLAALNAEPAFASRENYTDRVWNANAKVLEGLLGTDPWWETSGDWYGQSVSGLKIVASDPVRVIERFGFIHDGGSLTIGLPQDGSGRVLYRITSRGTGGTTTARVILQSIYAKRY